MVPVANFLVTPTLLSVLFTDISTGTPISWAWDFGDPASGVLNTSTVQNPTHVFITSGVYTIKLTTTNGDGVSSLQRIIQVSTVPVLPVTILAFVNCKLPAGNTIDEECKAAYIATAQLHIQPLVDPEVAYANVFDETFYPPLANALVAYMAAYNILLDVTSSGVTSNIGGAGGSSGAIKKIVTGPSEVEYQDSANLAKTLLGEFGLLSTLQKEACSLARRLNISLPFCPPLPKPIFINLKAERLNPSSTVTLWFQYPLAIKITI